MDAPSNAARICVEHTTDAKHVRTYGRTNVETTPPTSTMSSPVTRTPACARAATEPSDTHQPHATTTAWMRADR